MSTAPWSPLSRAIGALIALIACLTSGARSDDFSISSLPGLQWWASAAESQLAQNPDGTGAVGAGDPVGFMSDLSGHGHNAVMGSDSFRPTFQTNLASGGVGVLYSGSAFSSLQDAIFDGASAATIAIVIEGNSSAPGDRAIFGANSAFVGYTNIGNAQSIANVGNGSVVASGTGFTVNTFNSTQGSEVMAVIIARLQANGRADLWQNGTLISSTLTTVAGTPKLTSPAVKLLGARNAATTSSGISATATGVNQYFVEGLATNTALSDSQISSLNNYLTQKWPGIETISSSPNLYWDATKNSQRQAQTISAGHIEGVAAGDNLRYIFHTAMVEEYNSNWNLITNNQAMSTGIYAAGTAFHCGDGSYAHGKIFAPLELDLDGGGKGIAIYDATKPGLPLLTWKPLTTTHHEFSSLCVAPTLGASGIMMATSYYSGGDKLWLYDYARGDLASPNFGNFLGALTIPASVTTIQGVALQGNYVYFADAAHMAIERVLYQNGALASQATTVWHSPTTVQGMCFDGQDLLQVLQSGSSTEYAWTLLSSKFAVPVGAGSGYWNTSSGGNFNSNSGFDGMIPNGAGAVANFGGGTTNTVAGPPVHVTVNGAYTLGTINFNTALASYSLDADGQAGHSLTLNNGGAGAAITVAAGGHTIGAGLSLADAGGTIVSIAQGATLEIDGPVSLSQPATLELSGGGRLKLTGVVTVSVGARALVDLGATLELAIPSAPGSDGASWNVANNSQGNTDAGLVVSAAGQVIGKLNGSGSLRILAGGDLTAASVVQGSISIEGTSAKPGLLTLLQSQAGAGGGRLTSVHSLSSVLAQRRLSMPAVASGGNGLLGGGASISAVPEAPTSWLTALGAGGLLGGARLRAWAGGVPRLRASRRRSARIA